MREASATLEQDGVDVVWREAVEAAYPRPNELSVKVILVSTHPSDWQLDANSLGAVMGTGTPREGAYVFVNNAFAFLGIDYRPRSCPNPRKSHVIGRALGRIIVHEVVHAVAPGHPHSESGLMMPSFARDALTAKGPRVDDACGRAFRAAVHRYAKLQPSDRRDR